MVISSRRFAENLKEMHGIKKRHVKGVQNFCFSQLSMQILWRCRCSRVVDLKLLIFSTLDQGTGENNYLMAKDALDKYFKPKANGSVFAKLVN